MSWSITVKMENGKAEVNNTPNVKDGTYTFAGHDGSYGESISTGVLFAPAKND